MDELQWMDGYRQTDIELGGWIKMDVLDTNRCELVQNIGL